MMYICFLLLQCMKAMEYKEILYMILPNYATVSLYYKIVA